MTLRLGTRGSQLAMTQSRLVAQAVTAATGRPVELVEISTDGDRSTAPVARLGVGVFVSALRDALHAKDIDFAVHSFKDLPTAEAEGLHIAAVPGRADPRDALVARDGLTLAELPPGARIGTAAPRRVAQLRALGLDVVAVPVRGNVDTRLAMVAGGKLDAVILARAGLIRLGRAGEVTEIIDPALVLPAPAQGALAVECRTGDPDLVEVLGALDDPASRLAVIAERCLLATLEAGCSAPVGALADVTVAGPDPLAGSDPAAGGAGAGRPAHMEINLRGAAFSTDGTFAVRLSRTARTLIDPAAPVGAAGPDAAELGRLLAEDLLQAGANTVLGVQHDPHA